MRRGHPLVGLLELRPEITQLRLSRLQLRPEIAQLDAELRPDLVQLRLSRLQLGLEIEYGRGVLCFE